MRASRRATLTKMMEVLSDEALLRSLDDLSDIDVTEWRRVGGTAAGGYFEAAPGVIVAVPRPGFAQREADARRSLEEFHRIARTEGRPQAIVVLVDRVTSQDASSRRAWAEEKDNGLRCSLALVCSSALARAIGSFFIGLNRPSVPTHMFKDFPSALSWSEEKVQLAWEKQGCPP